MDGYHKIAVKNVGIINICFRREGMLFNQGRVVLDIDTYDFAGRITDDVIVGYYEEDMYHIHYYYKNHLIEINPLTQMIVNAGNDYEEYHLEFLMEFKRGNIPEDFTATQMRDEDFTVTFESMEVDSNIICRTLESNLDLLTERT
ncbi:MAG: hypothetical protein IJW20_05740 [Clostridia bacterium]|nr:hypothetical protein [Clostridia bacterium]